MGSSSHLPPYSSQPDPYPQPSPAQQARCLIPTKRLPAGEGELGRQRQGGAVGAGELHSEALWPGPWPGGADGPDRQHRVYSPPPPPPPLSFISHTDPRGWRRDRGGGRRKRQREGEGGGQMNTMKRLTRTTLTPSLPPSSSIHLWVQISLFPTGRLLPSPPLPLSPVWPLSCLFSPFIPQQPQPGRLCVAKHAPTGRLYVTVFLKVCKIRFSLLALEAQGDLFGG